jgi:hypothetical protein
VPIKEGVIGGGTIGGRGRVLIRGYLLQQLGLQQLLHLLQLLKMHIEWFFSFCSKKYYTAFYEK